MADSMQSASDFGALGHYKSPIPVFEASDRIGKMAGYSRSVEVPFGTSQSSIGSSVTYVTGESVSQVKASPRVRLRGCTSETLLTTSQGIFDNILAMLGNNARHLCLDVAHRCRNEPRISNGRQATRSIPIVVTVDGVD